MCTNGDTMRLRAPAVGSHGVAHARLADRASAVRAAEEPAVRLDAMADDLAPAVLAHRRNRLNRALEAIEDMDCALGVYLEGHVVVIAAHLALRHDDSSCPSPRRAGPILIPPGTRPGAQPIAHPPVPGLLGETATQGSRHPAGIHGIRSRE